jgi:sodium/proline symporter
VAFNYSFEVRLKVLLLLLSLCVSPWVHAGSSTSSTSSGEDLHKKAKASVLRVAAGLARYQLVTGLIEPHIARKKGAAWQLNHRMKGFLARQDMLDPWGNPWSVRLNTETPEVCSLGADPDSSKDDVCRAIGESQLGPRAAEVATRVRLKRLGKLKDRWTAEHGDAPWTVEDLLALEEGKSAGKLALEKDGWGLNWWTDKRETGDTICSPGPDNLATSKDDQCQEPVTDGQLAGIFIYLGILLFLGWLASRRMGDIKDFFAAGKKLGFITVAFSARATGESGWLLLGLTGMGAALGAKAFWVVGGEVLGVTIAWLFMSRRFKRLTDRYDSITVPDYLESRFKDSTNLLRLVSASTLVIFVTIYVSAQIDATGKAFEFFLDWNYFTGALVGFAVVMLYSVTGGFLAVVWSDVFQGTLMFVGLVTLPIVGLVAAGGFEPVFTGLEAQDPNLVHPLGTDTVDMVTIASILSLAMIGLGFLGSPQVFVRFLSLRDEDEIGKGAFVAILFTLLTDTGAVLIGMIGRYLMTDSGVEVDAVLGTGGENVLPLMVQDLLPTFVVGLYIAVVLSAIMSTVDSLLVVASSAAVRDVYQKVLNPSASDESLVPLCRRGTLVLGLVALAIALTVAVVNEDRTIFWFVIFGWSGIAATFCPTIILSLFWPRFSREGAIGAMITGFVSVPLFKFVAPLLGDVGPFFAGLGELPPAFLCSFAVGILVSMRKPNSPSVQTEISSDLEYSQRAKSG